MSAKMNATVTVTSFFGDEGEQEATVQATNKIGAARAAQKVLGLSGRLYRAGNSSIGRGFAGNEYHSRTHRYIVTWQ